MVGWIAKAAIVLVVAACEAAASSAPTGSVTPSTAAPTPSATAPQTPAPTMTPAPVSPARGRIAFLRTAAPDAEGFDQRDVFIVDADGSNLKQLTKDRKIESALYWLNDGSRLVIVWERNRDPYHQFLASVLPDGSDRTELGSVQTAYGDPARSPDGRYVAFGGDGDTTGETGLILLDLDTGARRVLTSDGATQPIWSPDGTRILAYLPSRRIGVVDVATGASVTRIRADVQRLIGWSDDGRYVYFRACTDAMNKLECMAAPVLIAALDGSEPSVAQDLPARIVGTESPDGAWVAALDGACNYGLMPIDEAEPIDLETADGIEEGCSGPSLGASWSPDSRWLATSAGSEASGSVITLVTPLGEDRVAITPGPSDGQPAWQPS